MSSFEYDSVGFDPPAPMIDVEISAPGSRGDQTVIRMLLDSGADMTCLPRSLVESLKSHRSGSIEVLGYTRRPRIRRTIYIDFRLAGKGIRDVEVLPVESEYGLLGRDIMNNFDIRLDGPRLSLSFLDGSRRRKSTRSSG